MCLINDSNNGNNNYKRFYIIYIQAPGLDFLVVTVEISSQTDRATVRGQDRVQRNVIFNIN